MFDLENLKSICKVFRIFTTLKTYIINYNTSIYNFRRIITNSGIGNVAKCNQHEKLKGSVLRLQVYKKKYFAVGNIIY